MTKVLEYEPLIDETLNKFVDKLALKFVDGNSAGKVCPADEWIGFCKYIVGRTLEQGSRRG